jgi:S-adenosylmethionine synthetase
MTAFSFTSESVTAGHPDKVADQISDGVLDALLRADPDARVACETLVARDLVVLAGEITSPAAESIDFASIAGATIKHLGYNHPELGFEHHELEYRVRISRQAGDIARGVNAAADDHETLGAGDQGLMFGYATDETPSLMPMPIMIAHRIAHQLGPVLMSEGVPGPLWPAMIGWRRPDGKCQVTVRYVDGRPVGVERVVVSAQHAEDTEAEQIAADVRSMVVAPVLEEFGFDPASVSPDDHSLLVNPTGRFVEGGPAADAGLTGRKIMVDTYGGMARHGGGAFSGKDPTKVDRSGAYAARWVAKNIVACGLASRCELQIAYAIGVARPVSLMIDTFGTGEMPDERLTRLVAARVDLRPAAIRERLELNRPIYRATASYGHFGRENAGFTWERRDLCDELTR